MGRWTSFTWILPSMISVFLIHFGSSESEVESPGIIYSNRVTLIKVDLETLQSTIIVGSQSNAVAVDYDIERNLVVWSDVRTNAIYSQKIDSDDNEIKVIAVKDIVTPDGLAVDWINGNFYWTDTGSDTLSVASLDGQMRKLLFHDDLNEPRAIVVDPLEGWMYWTDWGRNPKIERSGMDGTQRSTIISTNIVIPNGLAIDFESRKLFWADVQLHTLRSSDYDGSNIKIILYSTSKLGHPFAVDVFQDWLYWTDWRTHSITKVNKKTGEDMETVTTRSNFFPMGLRVYHRQKQPKGRKYCGEGSDECSFLCLPAPKGTSGTKNFTCVCPDGTDCSKVPDIVTKKSTFSTQIITKGVTFPHTATQRSTPATTNIIATTSLTAIPEQSELQSNSIDKILHEIHENVSYCGRFSGLIFGMFVCLIIVISVVVFYVYKQSLRGKTSGLRFINPVYRKQMGEADRSETGTAVDSGHDPLI